MSMSPRDRGNFTELLDLLREGQDDAEVRAQLQERILSDVEVRRFYIRRMQMIAALQWTFGSIKSRNAEVGASQSASATIRNSKPAIGFGSVALKRRILAVAVSLALVGYFAGVIGMIVWERVHHDDRRTHETLVHQQETVGRLAVANNCQWVGDPPSRIGDRLKDRTLALRKGVVELKLDRGATVVIEGPAEFEVRSPNGGYLRRGKLVATVPLRAAGFTIQTDTVAVVDFGTEFGVKVDERERTEVQVFEGSVALDVEERQTSRKTNSRILLHAGMARQVEPQRGRPASVRKSEWNPDGFVRRFPKEAPRSRDVQAVDLRAATRPLSVERANRGGPTERFTRSARFDTGLDGWQLLVGRVPGWIDANLTLGQAGGEAGGLISFGDLLADSALGGTFTADDAFTASGEFYIGDGSQFVNRALIVGFMNAEDIKRGEMRNVVGFQIADLDAKRLRFFAAFAESDYHLSKRPEPQRGAHAVELSCGAAYRFALAWNPRNHDVLTASVSDSGGKLLGVSTITPSDRDRAQGILLNAFGVAGLSMEGNLDFRVDNLTYSVSSEPR
jgi:hypothetical protein